jgi:hypothetical protein
MNLAADYDDEHSRRLVTNLNPKSRRTVDLGCFAETNSLVGYSVMAWLRNPTGIGSAFILARANSDATSAATEFQMSAK